MPDLQLGETDEPDYELRPAVAEPAPAPRAGPPVLWLAVVGLIAAGAVAAYMVMGERRTPASPERTPVVTEVPPPEARPLGADPTPIVLPPLDESDGVVRELVRQLSSHPQVAAWLTTDGLVRNFTVVVSNVGDGSAPAAHLRTLRPSAPFRTMERGDDLVIDPRSYERYNGLAAATASIDAAGAARLYATLKPRIEEASRELGSPDETFDRTLERAIVSLLATPIPDGPIRVEPKGIGYGYVDERLEQLTAAQKQLLRLGPENARTVQSSLRRIALALGIPGERLPAAR